MTEKNEYSEERCKGCACDTCAHGCENCFACLYAEYSEPHWQVLYNDSCEGFEGSDD